nr:hypothetical protein [uncultured Eisenbergiella sp.]
MSIEQNLSTIQKELDNLQKMVIKLHSLIVTQQRGEIQIVEKAVIVPVKNLTQEQMYFAYTKQKLTIQQIAELSGHKFSEEQIKSKILKEHTKYEHI